TTELIEASGRFQRPETENTKRSFDPMFWHKLTTSGAQFYASKDKRWVSCEAFTFINTKYRTTMEQIKRGTDLFLRDGITQFYNHGYFYTPEKELAPARDLIWMNRISHVNTWWPWYRGLADYQARAAFISRQGRAQAEVLVYSPMPTVWSERAEFPCHHVRDVPFGKLPKILVASGYDFDCVNDDLLQHHAEVRDGKLLINGYTYAVLVLPRAIYLATETLAVVERFVRGGGTVFALNTLPRKATGMFEHDERERQLAGMVQALFDTTGGAKKVGAGLTYFLPDCDGFDYLKAWSPGAVEWSATEPLSPAYTKFIAALRERLAPDFEITGQPLSDGLTFRHTRIGGVDAWFICNLQPNAARTEVILNTKERYPQSWNPMTGQIHAVTKSRATDDGRLALAVDLQPWASTFVLVTAKPDEALTPARELRPSQSYPLAGTWAVEFRGLGGVQKQMELAKLADWTTLPGLKDFSGTAHYTLEAELPATVTDKTKPAFLDLGAVHEVAHVWVNGADAGKVWMQPYQVDITGLLQPGNNKIQITVANLLWNYAAGLKQPNPIPQELQEHYGATWKQAYNGWGSLQAAKTHNQNDRLPSGLRGPVRLRTSEIVPLK
ncbi:MAG: glycosyl hydrolase, partial [Kiritimatiellaeota bacterium]|nr:glycosyl hydrolase [Kiritimatiellota bacterium]